MKRLDVENSDIEESKKDNITDNNQECYSWKEFISDLRMEQQETA